MTEHKQDRVRHPMLLVLVSHHEDGVDADHEEEGQQHQRYAKRVGDGWDHLRVEREAGEELSTSGKRRWNQRAERLRVGSFGKLVTCPRLADRVMRNCQGMAFLQPASAACVFGFLERSCKGGVPSKKSRALIESLDRSSKCLPSTCCRHGVLLMHRAGKAVVESIYLPRITVEPDDRARQAPMV